MDPEHLCTVLDLSCRMAMDTQELVSPAVVQSQVSMVIWLTLRRILHLTIFLFQEYHLDRQHLEEG